MKKTLLFVLTAITFSVTAQTSVYHPFPDSNAVWNVRIQYPCANPTHYCDQTYSYSFIGDTIIAGNTYHKIYVATIQLTAYGATCSSGCSGFQPGGSAGFIRQDTASKKVYFMEPGNSVEQLLYDFNLQAGDTVKGYYENLLPCSINPDIVSGIDSILIGGSYRKRWDLNGGNYQYLIEGIGVTHGVGTFANFLGMSDCGLIDSEPIVLTCFQQNDTILYHPFPSYDCDLITSIKNAGQKKFSPELFPNPFHSTATLQLKNNFERSLLKIYNTFGEQVRQQEIISHITTLSRNELSNGIYYFQVINSKGNLANGKFVIE